MYSNKLVLQILDYLDRNLFRQIQIAEISESFYYNKDYIMRLFKKELGFTIIEYIHKKRVFMSLDSLKNTNSSIINISITFGFSSIEYYSEIFKKIIGVSPTLYRKFSRFQFDGSFDEVYTIQDQLALLNEQMKFVEQYRLNIYKSEVKILSIFS